MWWHVGKDCLAMFRNLLQGESPKTIYEEIFAMYSKECQSHDTVTWWKRKFKYDCTSQQDVSRGNTFNNQHRTETLVVTKIKEL